MIECNLTLLCPSALEEKLLDVLLMLPQVAVLTSAKAAAHGVRPERLSTGEQVLGRAMVTQIQLLLRAVDKEFVLNAIRHQFAGAGIRYWITPVIGEGEIA